MKRSLSSLSRTIDDNDQGRSAINAAFASASGAIAQPLDQSMTFVPHKLRFPLKLHFVLEQASLQGFEHIISWLPDGKSFRIHDRSSFEQYIMPTYFPAMGVYKSFQKQLNVYGIYQQSKQQMMGQQPLPTLDTDLLIRDAYSHPLLVRGNTSLCDGFDRLKPGKKKTTLLGKGDTSSVTTRDVGGKTSAQHHNKKEHLATDEITASSTSVTIGTDDVESSGSLAKSRHQKLSDTAAFTKSSEQGLEFEDEEIPSWGTTALRAWSLRADTDATSTLPKLQLAEKKMAATLPVTGDLESSSRLSSLSMTTHVLSQSLAAVDTSAPIRPYQPAEQHIATPFSREQSVGILNSTDFSSFEPFSVNTVFDDPTNSQQLPNRSILTNNNTTEERLRLSASAATTLRRYSNETFSADIEDEIIDTFRNKGNSDCVVT